MPRTPMEPEWKNFVKEFKGNRCLMCGETHELQIHHKNPVRAGGGDELSNLWLLCSTCHMIEENRIYVLGHFFREILVGPKRGIFVD